MVLRYFKIIILLIALTESLPAFAADDFMGPTGDTMQELSESVKDFVEDDVEQYKEMHQTKIDALAETAGSAGGTIPAAYLLAKEAAAFTGGKDNPDEVDLDEVWDVIEDDYDDCEDKQEVANGQRVCGIYFMKACITYAKMHEYYVPVQILETTTKPYKSDFVTKDDAEEIYEEALEEFDKDDVQDLIKEDLADATRRFTKQGITLPIPAQYSEKIDLDASNRNYLGTEIKPLKQIGTNMSGPRIINYHMIDSEWDYIPDNSDRWTDRIDYWWHGLNFFGRRDPYMSESAEGLEVSYTRSGSGNDWYMPMGDESFLDRTLGLTDNEDVIPSCLEYHQEGRGNFLVSSQTPDDILPGGTLAKLKGMEASTMSFFDPFSPCLPGQFGKKGPFTHYVENLYPMQSMWVGLYRAARVGPTVGMITWFNEIGDGGDFNMPFHYFYPTYQEAMMRGRAKPDKVQLVKTEGISPTMDKSCKLAPVFWAGLYGYGPSMLTMLKNQRYGPNQHTVAVQWHYFKTCQYGSIPCGQNWQHAPEVKF